MIPVPAVVGKNTKSVAKTNAHKELGRKLELKIVRLTRTSSLGSSFSWLMLGDLARRRPLRS